ncbi:MAG: CehA/McbA family metallohydrolase [Vicinamibacterales bacterium]|jgi:hypothetical protein
MTRPIRPRALKALALLAALAALAVWAILPPAVLPAPPLADGGATARGAYHMHSDRSDGSASIDEMAAAAQRAGLQFIIVTDHGDGTRPPDAPEYRHGVLVIDAVELNTSGGHLVALGLPATPYPFAGAAADVLADVHRLGGVGFAAHPDSPRPSLRWEPWDAAVDGIEWVNADSGWRDEAAGSLARSVLSYWFRSAGSMAALLDRPDALLERWDAMGLTRSVPALAAADAHARLGFRQNTDPDLSTFHMPVPSYEAAFRTFSNHVVLDQALSGDGAADAAAVLGAIRQGRAFTVLDALATPGGLAFTATGGGQTARMGDTLAISADVTLRARISGPPGTTLVMLRNGQRVRDAVAMELEVNAGRESGVYRVEAHVPGAPGTPAVPWMLSNPIYVGLVRSVAAVDPPAEPVSRIPGRTAEVTIEKGARDLSELVEAQVDDARDRRFAGEPPIGWRFGLSPGAPAGQFAAVQLPTIGGLGGVDRVRFIVKAAAPIRAWVQLRTGRETERWGMTFYADSTTRMVDLPLSGFRPIGTTSSAAPPLDRVDSLLFVVDTLNSRPGATGAMTISEVAFVR